MSAPQPQAPLTPETFQATLVSARLVTPRIRELVFERADGKPFAFRSGQWVSLLLPLLDEKGQAVRRAYSVASVPTVPPGAGFELMVTRVEGGVGSCWLHEAAIGTKLEVKGPQGTFFRSVDAGPSLLVATGTGIAPFRGMVHDALAAGSPSPLWLLFGVRTPADALYRLEFEALEEMHPNFRFMLSLSRPPPEWTGRRGYVQEHVVPLWQELSTQGEAQAYICGIKNMLLEARAVLKTKGGARRQQLHLESYD